MNALIGHISLTLSSSIYVIWFIPQIILNFKRKDTEGLSMFMHGILCMGYLSDLIYGFGLGMQWQYRMVTIAGLCSLAIQHYQFGRYGLYRKIIKSSLVPLFQSGKFYNYILLSCLFISLLGYDIYILNLSSHSKNFYDHIGMLTNICWLCYMSPQIIKNFVNKSIEGLSPYFVMIAIFLNLCDMTSAWMLDWDYPSKVGPMISFTGNLILIFQVLYYGKINKSVMQLAVNR